MQYNFFRPFRQLLFVVFFAVVASAQQAKAQSLVFLDQLQSCTVGLNRASPVATGIGPVNMFYPYAAPATEYGQTTCGGTWAFDGASYLVTPNGATVFPGSALKAVWLNEASFDSVTGTPRTKGEMRRNVSGLTLGQIYRVTADAWHDDSPGDTALGLDFGPATATLAIPNDNIARSISAMVCAKSASLSMRLYEAGTAGNGASPVVTNIQLEDTGQSCLLVVDFVSNGGSAVAPQSVYPDDLATNPSVPTRPGYSFTGWFQDPSLTQLYSFATPVTQNITLYAGWAANPFHVSGTVIGLANGSTVTLANSNGDQVPVSAAGPFAFPLGLLGTDSYAVTVSGQPAAQVCTVTQAPSGPMNNADVTNVVVTCAATVPPSPTAVPAVSQWSLVGLSACLGLVGFMRIRRRQIF